MEDAFEIVRLEDLRVFDNHRYNRQVLDDVFFSEWKQALERELPEFWHSFSK